MTRPDDVLEYWLDEVGEKNWYVQNDDLDKEIRDKFFETWVNATEGALSLWLTYPNGTLAYLILTDQFSRNMFRNDPLAYSTDCIARAAAKAAIDKGWDLRVDEPARQFFYLPLMHSENLCDQERCVRLMHERMQQNREKQLLHARAHREEIRLFGRFPGRNVAIGRRSTSAETSYLAGGGYGSIVRDMQVAA